MLKQSPSSDGSAVTASLKRSFRSFLLLFLFFFFFLGGGGGAVGSGKEGGETLRIILGKAACSQTELECWSVSPTPTKSPPSDGSAVNGFAEEVYVETSSLFFLLFFFLWGGEGEMQEEEVGRREGRSRE